MKQLVLRGRGAGSTATTLAVVVLAVFLSALVFDSSLPGSASAAETTENSQGLLRRVRKMKMAEQQHRKQRFNVRPPAANEGFPQEQQQQQRRGEEDEIIVELTPDTEYSPYEFAETDEKFGSDPPVVSSSSSPYPIVRKLKQRRKKLQAEKKTILREEEEEGTPGSSADRLAVIEQANNRTEEDKRFLSLFTIVKFPNKACVSGYGNNGTCYSSGECQTLGGRSSGTCAQGFGVCCIFSATCGQTIRNNCTYFQSPGYPATYSAVMSCQLTVNKLNSNICQLRLDFENFNLAQPESTDNTCNKDQFIVTGGQGIPAICGMNTGEHIYVDVGTASNAPAVLTAVTGSSGDYTRTFSIKVSQIECSSMSKAPDGCLQYFTGVTGQVQTFNYENALGLQLSNTDYGVCFRMERNFCGIQYTACPDPNNNVTAMSFSITGAIASMVGSLVETNCNTDWVTIPCATNTNNPVAQSGTPTVCVDRICGMVFNSVTANAGTKSVPVTSYMQPFVIYVHTDSVEGSASPSQTGNRGFCLNYVEQPCTSSGG